MSKFQIDHYNSKRLNLRTVLRGAWAELYQIWAGHRAVIGIQGVCFKFHVMYLGPFRNSGGSKGEWCGELRPYFTLFDL